MKQFEQLTMPIKVNQTIIKNRVVVPPMADFGMTEASGRINERHLQHYGSFADGGAGLIIIEACVVSKMKEPRNTIRLYDDTCISGLSKLAEVTKRNQTVSIVQLLNNGLKLMTENTIAEISREKLLKYKEDYISAAYRCKKAGFDGIELHAAHGFFLNQVIEMNMRKDEYGGAFENRVRLLQELILEIKQRCGSDFIVAVRFGNRNLQELLETAKAIEEANGDVLDVSTGTYEYGNIPLDFLYDKKIYAASLVKKNVNIPVIGVGGIQTGEQAEEVLKKGYADLVAVGRGHLCNPNWTKKVFQGEKIDLCRDCGTCMWYIDGRKCPVVRRK